MQESGVGLQTKDCKTYHPISVISFLLRRIEKIIEQLIGGKSLAEKGFLPKINFLVKGKENMCSPVHLLINNSRSGGGK